MFTIETSGTWGKMGGQVGAAFPGELNACMNRFTPWLTLIVLLYGRYVTYSGRCAPI